jgi:hypothetical protein
MLFTDTTILEKRMKLMNKNNVEYKTIYSTVNKILLIRDLEKEVKIGMLDIGFKLTDDKIEINSKLLKNIEIAFAHTSFVSPAYSVQGFLWFESRYCHKPHLHKRGSG